MQHPLSLSTDLHFFLMRQPPNCAGGSPQLILGHFLRPLPPDVPSTLFPHFSVRIVPSSLLPSAGTIALCKTQLSSLHGYKKKKCCQNRIH